MQAVGPVALVSLLLNDGLTKAMPGSDVNENPNQPQDPAMQAAYNKAAVQVLVDRPQTGVSKSEAESLHPARQRIRSSLLAK